MKRNKVISDVVLNVVASVLPIITLQFIFLPLIASKIDAGSYGQLITIVALMNLSAATLGNILNNSRLINNKKYEELKIEGDYNLLLVLFLIVNIVMISIGLSYYGQSLNMTSKFLIILSSILLLLRGYGQVEFRIKLNFKNILLNGVFLLVGYGIGYLLFLINGQWEYLYFCGFATSVLFIYYKTKIFRETIKRTDLFKKTSSQTLILLISGLLVGAVSYVDKLLLYPILGGGAVAIYYTATILGKTILLIAQPIAGVLLSYLAQLNKLDNKKFYVLLISSLVLGLIGYIATILVSKPILSFLYPQYVDESMQYIYITTLTIIITIISNMLNPVLLKFCDLKWQIYINALYLIFYILLSISLSNYFGLMGFCVGLLIASFIKLFTTVVIYYLFSVRQNTKSSVNHL